VNTNYVCEKGTSRSSNHTYEEEIARRCWALPLNVTLPLSNGESCELLYAGRPGSSPGPDIRDAILSFTLHDPTSAPSRVLTLRNIFDGLSLERTDILSCNIMLTFAAAVGQQEHDSTLAERARNLYVTYSGLCSNQITRAMCKQLLLKSELEGACQQQGLHFIYAQTYREKRCSQEPIPCKGIGL
jgi:hypothetical protein